jgi:hypothetical protein
MSDAKSPISRPLLVDELAEDEATSVAVEATADERSALARRLGLPEIKEFQANFEVVRNPAGRVNVVGELRARLTRVCVVTLDPFETEVREPVSIEFAPEADAAAAAARIAHEPAPGESLSDQADPPDPIIGGRIDLGSAAAEFLALALDPYPRKPGASFSPPAGGDAADESPFAALARLKLDQK